MHFGCFSQFLSGFALLFAEKLAFPRRFEKFLRLCRRFCCGDQKAAASREVFSGDGSEKRSFSANRAASRNADTIG